MKVKATAWSRTSASSEKRGGSSADAGGGMYRTLRKWSGAYVRCAEEPADMRSARREVFLQGASACLEERVAEREVLNHS